MVNFRIRYSKTGLIRFTSHLDTMRIFSRAFYRSGLPIYFTEGFNPHPYITLGLPLSLGFESLCDICDFRLTEERSPEEILAKLQPVLPDGIHLMEAYTDPQPVKRISAARYRTVAEGAFTAETLETARRFFQQDSLVTTKKSKKGDRELDVRPMIKDLSLSLEGTSLVLDSLLAAGSTDNLNPELLLKLLRDHFGLTIEAALHTRTAILTDAGKPIR